MTVLELVQILEVLPEQDLHISMSVDDNMMGFPIDEISLGKSTSLDGTPLPDVVVLRSIR